MNSQPMHGPSARKQILVVCYGNICRSPMAEALLKKALREAGLTRAFIVRSAGVRAVSGQAAASGAQSTAEAHGLDLSRHRAKLLTVDMVEATETLIAMDEVVEEEIAILAGDPPIVLWPVDDPYGGPLEGYAQAFQEIQDFVQTFVAELQAQSRAR